MSTPYRAEIEIAAKAAGIDPDLVDALVGHESNYQVDAFRYEPSFWERYLKHDPAYMNAIPREVSSSYGLMQVMYPVALEHGMSPALMPEYLFLRVANLYYGCKILAALLAMYPVASALAAYNGGPGGIGKPVPTAYAADVLKRYAAIQAARA